MARELVYAPQALSDLDEAYGFIAEDSPGGYIVGM